MSNARTRSLELELQTRQTTPPMVKLVEVSMARILEEVVVKMEFLGPAEELFGGRVPIWK